MTASHRPINAHTGIVSADEAQSLIASDAVQPVDLGAHAAYLRGHLARARHLEFAALVDARGCGGGWMPPVEAVLPALAAAGINGLATVLACDDEGGGRASRLLWTLDALGLRPGLLLDGGMGAWARAQRPLEAGLPEEVKDRAACEASMREIHALARDSDGRLPLVDAAWIAERLDDPDVVVLDVRSPEEYRGEDVRAARGGHIPGAANYSWRRAVEPSPGGMYGAVRDRAVLLGELAALGVTPERQVVTHCQTHHRSSHTYVVLRSLGFERVYGYAGSWNEWGNDPVLPIAAGSSPR